MKPNFKFFYFDILSSTNDKAREFAREGKSNVIVVAGKQKKGRGRFGREWVSSSGGSYMTIVLKDKDLDKIRYLTFIAAVAVARTIKKISDIDAKVKWPNDVLIGHKKTCGILTETISGNENYALVGIGLNVNQKEFPNPIMRNSTSLKIESNKKYNIKKISKLIIEEFNNLYLYYNDGNYGKIKEAWKKYSHTLGKTVKAKTMSGDYIGNAVDLDDNCNLVLKLSNGNIKKIVEGDIFIV